MPNNFKRTIDEILTLYILEPSIKDIYVEGAIDKSIIELYVDIHQINCKFYEIDSSIDFSELVQNDLSLGSHRNKLITFSDILYRESDSTNVICVIDKDFDDFLDQKVENNFLLRSDFSCIESYIFNEETINKVLKIGFSNFPVNADEVIKEFLKVLPTLYFIRYVREINVDLKFSSLLKQESAYSINKAGVVTFNLNDYVSRYCAKNKFLAKSDFIIQEVENLLKNFNGDVRNCIHGHDFIEGFFRYVNIVKNTQNFRLENFEKALFMALEIRTFNQYSLFSDIYSRFNPQTLVVA